MTDIDSLLAVSTANDKFEHQFTKRRYDFQEAFVTIDICSVPFILLVYREVSMNNCTNPTNGCKFGNSNPVLQLGYAEIHLVGRKANHTLAHYRLREKNVFWVLYNSVDRPFETYTLLSGVLEMEYVGERRLVAIGETIDASEYPNLLSFYGHTDVTVLIEMTTDYYEPRFFETLLLQKEAIAIEKLDGYTYLHCNRIKDYSIELWKEMGLSTQILRTLRWGAYFHDIGKCKIPIDILNKPGKLTPAEWEIMKTHTTKGADLLRAHSVKWLAEAAHIVEQHHERFDGTGYPYNLKGNEISMEASIVAVVDAFDAMTTDRVYKKALPVEVALDELERGQGSQFHPEVVDAFFTIIPRLLTRWQNDPQ